MGVFVFCPQAFPGEGRFSRLQYRVGVDSRIIGRGFTGNFTYGRKIDRYDFTLG